MRQLKNPIASKQSKLVRALDQQIAAAVKLRNAVIRLGTAPKEALGRDFRLLKSAQSGVVHSRLELIDGHRVVAKRDVVRASLLVGDVAKIRQALLAEVCITNADSDDPFLQPKLADIWPAWLSAHGVEPQQLSVAYRDIVGEDLPLPHLAVAPSWRWATENTLLQAAAAYAAQAVEARALVMEGDEAARQQYENIKALAQRYQREADAAREEVTARQCLVVAGLSPLEAEPPPLPGELPLHIEAAAMRKPPRRSKTKKILAMPRRRVSSVGTVAGVAK